MANVNCSTTAGQGGSGIPSTETAMLCQSDQNNPLGNSNAASFYVPTQQLWQITSIGLNMYIQDGEACGNYNRETIIHFVCNSQATMAVLTGITESPTCYVSHTQHTGTQHHLQTAQADSHAASHAALTY